LVNGGPKQWWFDRGQPERRLEQRQARQYAERERLVRSQLGCGMFALGLIVRDKPFRGRGNCRQIEGQGRASDRSDREENSEARCKPTLQYAASMRPRAHRHLGRLPRATLTPPDRGAGRQPCRMLPAKEVVKSA
jgi:hypothetical protein